MTVVVSGIGLVTPLGESRESTWRRLLDNETGVLSPPHGLEAPIISFSKNGTDSRTGDFALSAAAQAFEQANLDPVNLDGQVIGCAISQSKPILFGHQGPPETLDADLLVGSYLGRLVSDRVAAHFGLKVPRLNLIAACATGVASIQAGAQWIEEKICAQVLVGASESSLNSFYRSGFKNMGVLCDGRDPKLLCPFDRRRSGFAMGEGAAVLLLEDEESARKRGHPFLARLKGVAVHHSASHAIHMNAYEESLARLIQTVLADSNAPDYINAHGTGTKMNDVVEVRGIRRAFDGRENRFHLSSTKPATGHLLGAAGAVEAAFAVLAIRDNAAPATLNLEELDHECRANHISRESIRKEIRSSLSLSYGFGGQLGAVFFERGNDDSTS